MVEEAEERKSRMKARVSGEAGCGVSGEAWRGVPASPDPSRSRRSLRPASCEAGQDRWRPRSGRCTSVLVVGEAWGRFSTGDGE